MRILGCACLALSLSGPIAPFARADVVDSSELDAAIAEQLKREDDSRENTRSVLARPQIRELAERLDLDIVRAQSAVEVLDADELATVGEAANQIDRQLSGGDRNVSISLVSLLLIIIIVILIAD
jgi:hypothetical protein